jgi:hypothetical protein
MGTPQRTVYFNPTTETWAVAPCGFVNAIAQFHQQLFGHHPTSLLSLEEVANELGIRKGISPA